MLIVLCSHELAFLICLDCFIFFKTLYDKGWFKDVLLKKNNSQCWFSLISARHMSRWNCTRANRVGQWECLFYCSMPSFNPPKPREYFSNNRFGTLPRSWIFVLLQSISLLQYSNSFSSLAGTIINKLSLSKIRNLQESMGVEIYTWVHLHFKHLLRNRLSRFNKFLLHQFGVGLITEGLTSRKVQSRDIWNLPKMYCSTGGHLASVPDHVPHSKNRIKLHKQTCPVLSMAFAYQGRLSLSLLLCLNCFFIEKWICS